MRVLIPITALALMAAMMIAITLESGRSLSKSELAELFGGDDYYCCKHLGACDGSERTCADPLENENPQTPPYMLCAARTDIEINTSHTKYCGPHAELTPNCVESGDDYDCHVVTTCVFNQMSLACEKGGTSNTVSVKENCTPDCPT